MDFIRSDEIVEFRGVRVDQHESLETQAIK